MKNIIALLIFIGGVIVGGYVGGWCMFVQPIISACQAFDAGTLTALIVGVTVLKCIFASAVFGLIVFICSMIATFVSAIGD